MHYRIEKDTLGEIKVNQDNLWGAQTQRSLENFSFGDEKMPKELIVAYAYLKRSCAISNHYFKKLPKTKKNLIVQVCDEIIANKLDLHFPLHVWQTGSGTQTNMNLNEVISNRAFQIDSSIKLNPNDDVNMSQSSNDTFPSAMKIATIIHIQYTLKSLDILIESYIKKVQEFEGIIKIGRTHLQDATPLFLSDEIGGYIAMLQTSKSQVLDSLKYIKELPIGATAVGTGLNSPNGFSQKVCEELNAILGLGFVSQPNKFQGLSSHDAEVFLSGALNTLASNLMKIANDTRWLASGPMCAIGELKLPANEPGSSIMPGKVNPTQAEAITMIAIQVMGNHTAISFASSQGNFELNVFKPLIVYNLLQSIKLLDHSMKSFATKCVDGIELNKDKIDEYLQNSLMNVTALNQHIGYENSAKIAKYAYSNNVTLKEAGIELGLVSTIDYDKFINLEKIAKGSR
jgi:fumarate hydratase class II